MGNRFTCTKSVAALSLLLCVAFVTACSGPPKRVVEDFPYRDYIANDAEATALYILRSVADDKLEQVWELLPQDTRTQLVDDWNDEKERIRLVVAKHAPSKDRQEFEDFYSRARALYPDLPELKTIDDVDRISVEQAYRSHLLDHTFANGYLDQRMAQRYFGSLRVHTTLVQSGAKPAQAETVFVNIDVQVRIRLQREGNRWMLMDFDCLDDQATQRWFQRYLRKQQSASTPSNTEMPG